MRCLPMLLVCPLLSGCFAFAYPSIDRVPAVAVEDSDVKAFRVTEDTSTFGLIAVEEGPQIIEEIKIVNGEIPAKTSGYCAYGFLAFPIGGYNAHHESIRLYKRGYETVTITSNPWLFTCWNSKPEKIEWKEARTLDERARAIAAIYWPTGALVDVTSRTKNEFIADELVALARSELAAGNTPEMTKLRQHLEQTAEAVRKGLLHGMTLNPLDMDSRISRRQKQELDSRIIRSQKSKRPQMELRPQTEDCQA